MGSLTIKDIAKMAGVSPTVVSFVINEKKGVSPSTREKVLKIVEQMQFKPSISSRRLIMKKSFNIGIVMANDSSPFSNLFYFEIARGLLERSKVYGYNVIFTDIRQSGKDLQLPGIIENQDTDGIIFFQDAQSSFLQDIESRGIPCVVIDAHPDQEEFAMIKVDYECAARAATEFLISYGHQHIAFISSSFVPNFYTQVFNGYRQAMSRHGLAIPSGWIQMDAVEEQSAYTCMERILQSGEMPTAVFCATDLFAISAMKCARAHGMRIPEDLSFIGIDDILLSQYIEPALTTVRIDKADMGGQAMDMIIRRINGEKPESLTVVSDHLIIRDSVRNFKEA